MRSVVRIRTTPSSSRLNDVNSLDAVSGFLFRYRTLAQDSREQDLSIVFRAHLPAERKF